MSQREQYTKQKLYEEAFNVNYDWEKCLPPKCFQFHNLTCMETNASISLQMGVMLPFVSACLGANNKRLFHDKAICVKPFLAQCGRQWCG